MAGLKMHTALLSISRPSILRRCAEPYVKLTARTYSVWPLPLLHGRGPDTLAAIVALMLPFQFPQAREADSPSVNRYLPCRPSPLASGLGAHYRFSWYQFQAYAVRTLCSPQSANCIMRGQTE